MSGPKDIRPAMPPSLIDYLIVFAKWKRQAGMIFLLLFLAGLVLSLAIPPVYLAETRILPGGSDSLMNASRFMNQLGDMSNLPGLGGKNDGDLYAGLLRSRTVLDRVSGLFELRGRYGVDNNADVRRLLLKKLHVDIDRKSGIVTIGVEDRDPERSADMANAFVDELRRLDQNISMSEAARRRQFYEDKLREVKDSLVKAEEAMKGYQERTGALEMKEQAKAVIESVARVRAQIATAEVRLKVLRTYATPQNPDVQKGEEELKGLKEQQARLEAGGGSDPDPLMSAGAIPRAGTGYVRKMRDLKYNETLFELLAKQYEMAKLEESRNSAVQVVDRAVPPEKRLRPKRSFIVLLAGSAGIALGLLAALLLEKRERLLADPAMLTKVEELKRHAGLEQMLARISAAGFRGMLSMLFRR